MPGTQAMASVTPGLPWPGGENRHAVAIRAQTLGRKSGAPFCMWQEFFENSAREFKIRGRAPRHVHTA